MSYLIGARNQQQLDDYYDCSGTIITGGTPQLCIPQRKSCTKLVIQNLSSGALAISFGVLPATATLTNGVLTALTVNDAGFGFQVPPTVLIMGGGNANDPASKGATAPDWPTPYNVATAVAVLGTSAISGLQINSFTITNPGSGYLAKPYVRIVPDRTDPTGVGLPSLTAGGSYLLSASGGNYYDNGTACPTTAISIIGATTGQAYTAKWMP